MFKVIQILNLRVSSFLKKKDSIVLLSPPPRAWRVVKFSFFHSKKENRIALRNKRNIKYQLFVLGKNNFDQKMGVPLFIGLM